MFTLKMESIAFNLGPIPVHWYGIILGTAALVGLLLAVQEGKRFGLSPEFFMDLLLFGVPSAIIGARIYFVAFKWDEYKNDLPSVFAVWNGGIAIYGALIGAFICGFIYFRYKGYNFWRIADICAPGLLAGQMIGRWGNFVNQEAYGGPAEESFLRDTLHLPGWIVNQMNVEGVFHHPTFLYESLWSLVGIIVLMVLRRRPFLRAGELLFSYFIWYSIGRFFIEALRTDSLGFNGPSWLASFVDALWSPMTVLGFEQGYLDPAYGNIRISQLLALFLVIGAIALIIIRRQTGLAKARYLDPIISTKTGMPAGAEAASSDAAAAQHADRTNKANDETDLNTKE
ncbi:phosphatidylglycerol:prolipoprotein diacylglycerol transferase [Paenibacillus phyllosphaerae]|uniref:Phosphatidylglycerol--prolipoprotein diacylglyceryl transferase n=1 Tax=Paenibacillus phyllosphaerae TaxID=274593 RepID=A0A7W5B2B3_9BACL|nr:prolipoprotein diacylglyceryl transferase [Paenibacillus phyllosphaerae]MBB3113150.1 phosphatidylglycerol:prolipoprotein diacylglycerol transferase [Paenibacillus phyllosphaerae]